MPMLMVFLLPAGLADGQERACTQVGCTSGISVALPAPSRLSRHAARATVCMNDHCRVVRLRGRKSPPTVALIAAPATGPDPVRVRVVIRDVHGRRLLRAERRVSLMRTEPNGPECPPTCWFAALKLDARGHLAAG